MGRFRSSLTSIDREFRLRPRRKRAASCKGNVESAPSVEIDQATVEGKRALYHCNYCNKDISGKIHFKCAHCTDFDLCVECFSVGAEVTPHKSNHPYRVMDDLSFPLICPEWNADEEILLLEGFEMYGLGDWDEIAEHVGTKSKAQCIDHYTSAYVNSLYFPLPDMSHVAGKNRKELLSSAKGHCEDKKGFSTFGELKLTEPFTPSGNETAEPVVGILIAGSGAGFNSITAAAEGAVKKASNTVQTKHVPAFNEVEDPQVDRSIGTVGKKPESSADEGPSLIQLSGYNLKRQEFDPEYDNDAEQSIAEMEFNDTDTEADHELKLRMLHIYNKRLDERKHRKDFILERNLLYSDPLAKDLSPREKEIYNHYNAYMRFHSPEEHTQLIETVIQEHRIRKRILELKEAHHAGCRTSAEANRYLENKRKKGTEESGCKVNGGFQNDLSSRVTQMVKGSTTIECRPKDSSSSTAKPVSSSHFNEWDITGLPGSHLLSESEKRLCCETKMLPCHYLKLQEVMSIEVFKGNITKKSDAHRFFKVDLNKVDRVYDILVRKGIAVPE